MHQNAEYEVEGPELVLPEGLVVLDGDTGVDHEAEGQEVGVLSQQQDDEDTMEVHVRELVDDEVNDEEEEEAEERLQL